MHEGNRSSTRFTPCYNGDNVVQIIRYARKTACCICTSSSVERGGFLNFAASLALFLESRMVDRSLAQRRTNFAAVSVLMPSRPSAQMPSYASSKAVSGGPMQQGHPTVGACADSPAAAGGPSADSPAASGPNDPSASATAGRPSKYSGVTQWPPVDRRPSAMSGLASPTETTFSVPKGSLTRSHADSPASQRTTELSRAALISGPQAHTGS